MTATMVSRNAMGSAAMLERVAYMMVSGWEIVFYALLGLVCGGLAYAFIQCCTAWRSSSRASALSGCRRGSAASRRRCGRAWAAAGGGTGAGTPVVWDTGHEYTNDALL